MLIVVDDVFVNEVSMFYFDMFYYIDNGWEIKNQFFYESYENLNENVYGFF